MTSVQDIKHRRIAITALGSPEVSEKAVACLLAFTADVDEKVRSSAWMSLAKTRNPMGMKRAAEAFPLAGIQEKKNLLLSFAIEGIVVDSALMSLLVMAVADSDKSVRDLADRCISRMGLTTAQWRTITQAQSNRPEAAAPTDSR